MAVAPVSLTHAGALAFFQFSGSGTVADPFRLSLGDLSMTNIVAGDDGAVGTVTIFPTTADKGTLVFTAADNTGDTATTIVNAEQAGARTYTIPDAGASASFVMTAGAQTLAGVKTFSSVPVFPVGGITAGSTTITETEFGYLDGVTLGTVTASKLVSVDANKDVGDFRNLDAVNLDAGASGTAGSVDVFPSTASKGKIALVAADSAGDTTTTITNASQAGARTYTIPDAGASASFVMTAGTQTFTGVTGFTAQTTFSSSTTRLRNGTGSTNADSWALDVQNASGSDALSIGYTSSAYTTGGLVGWLGNSMAFCYRPSTMRFGVGVGSAWDLELDASGNVSVGLGTLATNATDGFAYLSTSAGLPTGTPTTKTGYAPVEIDTTNNKLMFYSGSAWRASNAPLLVAASGDGAISAREGQVWITKGSAAALTLADPTSGTDDGKTLEIIAATAHAHTVDNSAGSGFNGGGAGADIGTFGGARGDNLILKAYQGVWYVASKTNVTLA